MLKYDELSKIALEREVSWSTWKAMAGEMAGKTDEEKNEISRRYAKIIAETCPPRKKASSR